MPQRSAGDPLVIASGEPAAHRHLGGAAEQSRVVLREPAHLVLSAVVNAALARRPCRSTGPPGTPGSRRPHPFTAS